MCNSVIQCTVNKIYQQFNPGREMINIVPCSGSHCFGVALDRHTIGPIGDGVGYVVNERNFKMFTLIYWLLLSSIS